MKYFTSDWHLGHANILKFSKRPFSSVEEMDRTIISNLLEIIQPDDEIYHLGDLASSKKAADDFFDRLPRKCRFHWIRGNHDKVFSQFRKNCASQSNLKEITINNNGKKTTVTLCHYPLITWNKSHYNHWQLYGHHHLYSYGTDQLEHKAAGKQINVCVEFHKYKPVSEKQVIQMMHNRPDNWDLLKNAIP